jgi:uncharacterized protein YecA (UPF0149 family)
MTELIKLYEPTSTDLKEAKAKELSTLADEAKQALYITITDKKTYETVHTEQMKLRNARVEIEKARKDFTVELDEKKK